MIEVKADLVQLEDRDGQFREKDPAQTSKEKMTETIGMFGKLPDHCLACKVPYNKKSKKAASTWRVSVDTEKQVVKLYCPQCWAIAEQIAEEIIEEST